MLQMGRMLLFYLQVANMAIGQLLTFRQMPRLTRLAFKIISYLTGVENGRFTDSYC